MRNLLDQYPWLRLSAKTSEYHRYLHEQKIEKIKEIICTAVLSCLLCVWAIVFILVNL